MARTELDPAFVTTAFELPGYRIARNLGVVRGIIVRSRSVIGSIGAGLQTLFGGNITLYTALCERTREDAFNLMISHAADLGANAIVGARYGATEIMSGGAGGLAHGTAVVAEALGQRSAQRPVRGEARRDRVAAGRARRGGRPA